jgi:predicted RNA-binding Zn ribbon-like protein
VPKSVAELKLIGGPLCLDFTNTVEWRSGPRRRELLTSYPELLSWGRHAGILDQEAVERLAKHADRQPVEAEQVLRRALGLRAALYGIFHSLAQGLAVNQSDLGILNQEIEAALGRLRLVEEAGRLAWTWVGQDRLDFVLGPIVRSFADLAASPLLTKVRECQATHCGWLFLDTSKNRTRKWCQMSDCGNREKARRHYRRNKAAASGSPGEA